MLTMTQTVRKQAEQLLDGQNLRFPPEPAEHVASMATVSADVTPGEPVVKLRQFVLSRQVHLLVRLSSSYNGN